MLENLKLQVYKASLKLQEQGLVIFTWGNVSAIDRKSGLVVIKPTGISYDEMVPGDMVVVDLNGKVQSGDLKPSSDTHTHLVLYQNFPEIGSIVHSHSEYASCWAQAGLGIPPLGISHANFFNGEIPCTLPLSAQQLEGDLETETGKAIVETFRAGKIDPARIPGILVYGHGPFCWGKSVQNAFDHTVAIEKIARMAYRTRQLNPVQPVGKGFLDRYFLE
ncbi:MAG: L-ribulose-5-phosphate 4-epimerase AraD [Marinilabiliales bacterium]|nr:L-ribulose-5-phosphate 4-epimerase AraD [Marinilabiliales bacterium]